MTKLSYPSDGVYRYCKNNLISCHDNLQSARWNCNFDIPYGFRYRNYLFNLNYELGQYINTINDLDDKIRKINDNFEELETDMSNDVNKLPSVKIKDRDRMIV